MSFLLKTNVRHKYNLKPVNGLMGINIDYAKKKIQKEQLSSAIETFIKWFII